ncbi:hypothetical protein HK327_11435, partial [Streptococcus agalactiae]|nr:hypothetical protein [Streptococcus agalactiae]
MITEEDCDSFLSRIGIASDKADSTLISYTKPNRSFSKKMATQLLYNLNTENMELSIESRGFDCIESLADEMSGYFPDIDTDNVATRVPQIFADIIRQRAGVSPADAIQKNNLRSQSSALKKKHGRFLLVESNNRCAFPSCDSLLI